MIAIDINVDDAKLTRLLNGLTDLGAKSNVLPNVAKSVGEAAIAVQQRWRSIAAGSFHRSTGTYLRGIDEGYRYPYSNDPYRAAVINTVKHARYIEDGTSPHDLKSALHTSHQVRVSKDGKRYLIIPFRHGTPRMGAGEAGAGSQRAMLQSMPVSVYKQAKELAVSRRLKGYAEPSVLAGGKKAYRGIYQWGERLKGMGNIDKRANWKSSPYEGMVRIPREEPMASGGIYMTFRVMHEDSSGWMHPGTPPMKLAEKTATEMKPVVMAMIKNGFEADLSELGLRR